MQTIKNHAEKLVVAACIIGLYLGAVAIGTSWAITITQHVK